MEESRYVEKRSEFISHYWNPTMNHDETVKKLFEEILIGECNFTRYEEQMKDLKNVGLDEFASFFEVEEREKFCQM